MRRLVALALVLLLIGSTCFAGVARPEFGVGVKVPLSLFAQLRLSQGLAPELAVPVSVIGAGGLAVSATAKLYLAPFVLFDTPLQPFLRAGVSALIGQVVTTGIHAVAGLEYTIPRTSLSLFGELALSYASVMGFSGVGGGDVGVRFDL